jgi:PAS domain S-box-containing protein
MVDEKINELLSSFQLMVQGMENYSLILLDTDGTILTWNKGAEKLKGYRAEEILGQHYSIFYLPSERQAGLPKKLMDEATEKGNASFVGRRIRKNGTIFWGKVDMTAIKDTDGTIIGFTKLARELSDQTAIGNYWFDQDGVLHGKINSNPHTPEAVMEFRNSLSSALNGQKICMIADIRDARLTQPGKTIAQPGAENIYKAIAFISDTTVDRNTKAILELIPSQIPVRVFETRGEAKEWIREFNV